MKIRFIFILGVFLFILLISPLYAKTDVVEIYKEYLRTLHSKDFDKTIAFFSKNWRETLSNMEQEQKDKFIADADRMCATRFTVMNIETLEHGYRKILYVEGNAKDPETKRIAEYGAVKFVREDQGWKIEEEVWRGTPFLQSFPSR